MIIDAMFYDVPFDRTSTPQALLESLEARGFRVMVSPEAVETMPRGDGHEGHVHLFAYVETPTDEKCKRTRGPTDEQLAQEYLRRKLVADPRALLSLYRQQPGLAYTHRSTTHWCTPGGRWCYLVIMSYADEPHIVIGFMGAGDTHSIVHDGGNLFAGSRQPAY